MRSTVTLTHNADDRVTTTAESWAPTAYADPEPDGIDGLLRTAALWSAVGFFDVTVRIVRRRRP